MAKAHLTVTIDAKNMDRVRLLGWELMELVSEMRVMASPHADKLEAIMARFTGGEQDDDRPEDDPTVNAEPPTEE